MTGLFDLVSLLIGVAAGLLSVWVCRELGVTSDVFIWLNAGAVTAAVAHCVTITISAKYIEYHKAKLEKGHENEKT